MARSIGPHSLDGRPRRGRSGAAFTGGLVGPARALAPLTAIAMLAACSNPSSVPEFGPPNVDRILVFYPVAGLVRGRGLSDAAPGGASHVFIKAHPNGSETIQRVDGTGGFEFALLARGGNVLEISGATDNRATERGEPAFIQVPVRTYPNQDYVCCFEGGAARGRCQTVAERDAQLRESGEVTCPLPLSGRVACTSDIECGFEEGEWLQVDVNRINVSRPNEVGRIEVSGFVEPRSLVTLQNRSLSGIGVPSEQTLTGGISSDVGDFTFSNVRARGDDELILQVEDLNGIRSPQVSILVDDAPIAGLDVTGAYAQRPLQDDQVGTVAIQFAPFGVDNRGVCPNHDEQPETCFTGGLTHDMVELRNVTVDDQPVTWSAATATADRPNRGAFGDVRAGPLDIVLVLDRSANADIDEESNFLRNPSAVEAVREFVTGLRQRDRVGAVVFGGSVRRLNVPYDDGRPRSAGLFEGGPGRTELVRAIENELQQPGAGDPNIFAGIEEAALMLTRSANAGRIVVITTGEHPGSAEDSLLAFDTALEAIELSTDASQPLPQVDVIGVSVRRTEKFLDIAAITDFTVGEYFDLAAVQSGDVNQLALVLADVRATLSGSFLLLYEIMIPPGTGKAARLKFDAILRMDDAPPAVPYSGLLRVDLAAN